MRNAARFASRSESRPAMRRPFGNRRLRFAKRSNDAAHSVRCSPSTSVSSCPPPALENASTIASRQVRASERLFRRARETGMKKTSSSARRRLAGTGKKISVARRFSLPDGHPRALSACFELSIDVLDDASAALAACFSTGHRLAVGRCAVASGAPPSRRSSSGDLCRERLAAVSLRSIFAEAIPRPAFVAPRHQRN